MDKNVKIGMLLDIYGELLTDKQKDILDLYYNNNLSLAEIAEEVSITRQAVRDSIVKGEKKLFRFRRKAWNYEKNAETRKTDTKDIIRIISNTNQIYWWTNRSRFKSCSTRTKMLSIKTIKIKLKQELLYA